MFVVAISIVLHSCSSAIEKVPDDDWLSITDTSMPSSHFQRLIVMLADIGYYPVDSAYRYKSLSPIAASDDSTMSLHESSRKKWGRYPARQADVKKWIEGVWSIRIKLKDSSSSYLHIEEWLFDSTWYRRPITGMSREQNGKENWEKWIEMKCAVGGDRTFFRPEYLWMCKGRSNIRLKVMAPNDSDEAEVIGRFLRSNLHSREVE